MTPSVNAATRSRQQQSRRLDLHMQFDSLLSNIIIGGISGTISNVAVFPIELVKTKIQNACSAEDKLKFRNCQSAVRVLTEQKGIAGLWEGVTPVLLGSAPESAIQLAVHSFLVTQLALTASESSMSLQDQMLAGAVAGAATLVVTNPMEVLRLYALQCEGASIAKSVRELGLSGLFSGSTATLLRDVPFAALYFTLYGQIKTAVGPGLTDQAWLSHLIAGIGAGAFASYVTTPLDLLKTRVQSRVGQGSSMRSIPLPRPGKQRRLAAAFATDEDLSSVEPSAAAELARIVQGEGWAGLMQVLCACACVCVCVCVRARPCALACVRACVRVADGLRCCREPACV